MSSSRAASDITETSIDNIIQELLSHAEIEVEDSVRSIEETCFPDHQKVKDDRSQQDTRDQPAAQGKGNENGGGFEPRFFKKSTAPVSSDDLPSVEAENSFTPSFAEESSVWYDTPGYDNLSEFDVQERHKKGKHREADTESVQFSDATALSDTETESEVSLRSSQQEPYGRKGTYAGEGGNGGRYASRDAMQSVQSRLLHVMRKEAKLHIKAEMTRTELEVLKSKLGESEAQVHAARRTCKHLEGKIKQLKAQDTYQQCKKLQASLAKSTELNSKLVHKIQALKLELRKEKARRHHAEQTAKLSFSGKHVPLDVMDSMESLETFKMEQTMDPISLMGKSVDIKHFDSQDTGFEVSDLRNQVRHLKGALEQAEAANNVILSHIQEESPSSRPHAGAGASTSRLVDDAETYSRNQSNAHMPQVINLHNFLSKPVIAEVKSSLAELKSSLSEEHFNRFRDRQPNRAYDHASENQSTAYEHQYASSGVGGMPSRSTVNQNNQNNGNGVQDVVHSTSSIPPQNMDKDALKQARDAYQEEVKRMRQLFLSRISDEEQSGSPARSK